MIYDHASANYSLMGVWVPSGRFDLHKLCYIHYKVHGHGFKKNLQKPRRRPRLCLWPDIYTDFGRSPPKYKQINILGCIRWGGGGYHETSPAHSPESSRTGRATRPLSDHQRGSLAHPSPNDPRTLINSIGPLGGKRTLLRIPCRHLEVAHCSMTTAVKLIFPQPFVAGSPALMC
jgi:hypothetical protein